MLVFSLAPLYWMLVVSLKGGASQLISGNPWWPGAQLILDNYARVLGDPDFGRLILNTALVTLATIAISLAASVLAALGLAHYRLRFSNAIALTLFAAYLLPQGVLFIPLAVMLSRLHLFGGISALIAVYPTLVIPFGTWVLWTSFHRLPADLVDTWGATCSTSMIPALRSRKSSSAWGRWHSRAPSSPTSSERAWARASSSRGGSKVQGIGDGGSLPEGGRTHRLVLTYTNM